MFGRGQINEEQFGAGMRFLHDHYLSGLVVRRTSKSRDPAYHMPATGRMRERRESYRAARAALTLEQFHIIEPVVLSDKTAGEVTFLSRWKNRTRAIAQVMRWLKTGLDRLAVHYGIVYEDRAGCLAAELLADAQDDAEPQDRLSQWDLIEGIAWAQALHVARDDVERVQNGRRLRRLRSLRLARVKYEALVEMSHPTGRRAPRHKTEDFDG